MSAKFFSCHSSVAAADKDRRQEKSNMGIPLVHFILDRFPSAIDESGHLSENLRESN